jgi:hypothetical protein
MAKANGNGKKTSAHSSGLIPQPHGGALLPGAGGGPQPGAGRPPSHIRLVAREAFAKRIPILERIADDEDERSTDRVAALKLLSDTGGVDKIALTLDEQPERQMTRELAAEWWERIKGVRTLQEFERILISAAK